MKALILMRGFMAVLEKSTGNEECWGSANLVVITLFEALGKAGRPAWLRSLFEEMLQDIPELAFECPGSPLVGAASTAFDDGWRLSPNLQREAPPAHFHGLHWRGSAGTPGSPKAWLNAFAFRTWKVRSPVQGEPREKAGFFSLRLKKIGVLDSIKGILLDAALSA
nr:hypothetical protein Iba_chr15eCG1110 [Ipomoea batatas]